jgi:hypothetical protein
VCEVLHLNFFRDASGTQNITRLMGPEGDRHTLEKTHPHTPLCKVRTKTVLFEIPSLSHLAYEADGNVDSEIGMVVH